MTGQELVKGVPRETPMPRAAAQPLLLTAQYAPVELGQAVVVPRTTVVSVMPQQFPFQRRLLLRNWAMAEPAAPVGDLLGRQAHPAAGCLGLYGPAPASGLAPVQRKAQEIECLRFWLSWARAGKPRQA